MPLDPTPAPPRSVVLRSALTVAWMMLTMLPWAVLALIASLFVKGARLYWVTTYWTRIAAWGWRHIAGMTHRIHGWAHVQQAQALGAVVVVSKHQSAWETLGFCTFMPVPLAFVYKAEIRNIPFFGWALARMDMIHIDRHRRRQALKDLVDQGQLYMNRGSWVLLFPEGTRSDRGQSQSYKLGGSHLAVASGRPILPVAVTSARCWGPRSLWMYPGVIDVSFGPLIASEGRGPGELMAQAEQWIEAEMRRLDPEGYVHDADHRAP